MIYAELRTPLCLYRFFLSFFLSFFFNGETIFTISSSDPSRSKIAILPRTLHRWRKTNFLTFYTAGRQQSKSESLDSGSLGLLQFIIREKHGRLLCRRRKSKRRLAAREETLQRLKRNAPINRHVWTFHDSRESLGCISFSFFSFFFFPSSSFFSSSSSSSRRWTG